MRLAIIATAALLMAQAPAPQSHPATAQQKQLQQENDQLVGKLMTLREHHKGKMPEVLEDRAMEPSQDPVDRLTRANASLKQQLHEAQQKGIH